MEKIGIICEYNPFHNGHLYHIKKIKELYPDSLIILVLGGYFLERGEVSLISKWNKTSLALDYGINLVLELPTLFNTNSADIFGYTAVKILSKFAVDKIVFGSESDDIASLKAIVERQNDDSFKLSIKESLSKGENYPTSLSRALGVTLKSNDILAVSYIKAIKEIDLSIIPISIKRTNEYDDIELIDNLVSAQNIRARLQKGENISKFIPSYDQKVINKIDAELLFQFLRYKIITDDHLERYLGVDEGIENRLKKIILKSTSYDSLVENLKTKRYTISRINRLLIHILLGIEKSDIENSLEIPRVLGFDSQGQEYLKNFDGKYRTCDSQDKISLIEKKAALIYYDLTKDISVKYEFLNCPIIKESRN